MVIFLTLLMLLIYPAKASSHSGYPVFRILKHATYDVDWGTGFNVSWHGKRFLITNWHVCRHYSTVMVKSAENPAKNFRTHVVASFPSLDLCLLNPVGDGSLEVGKSVEVGYPVFTAGYPQSSNKKVIMRSGKVVAKNRSYLDFGKIKPCPSSFVNVEGACKKHFWVWDTTLKGEPGCSGSPVVNSKGKLVGIVNQYNNKTLSYLPVESLIRVLKSLEAESP